MSSSQLTLLAPATGILVPLASVPDPVFAGGTLGEGIALDPLEASLHAPCDGEVVQCAKTHHAITLRTEQGVEILLHLGLDTVELQGRGIQPCVEVGQRVRAGQPLCHFDVELLAEQATSLITPLVVIDDAGWRLCPEAGAEGDRVERGAPLIRLIPASGDNAACLGQAGPWQEGEVALALEAGLHARPAARLRAIVRRHAVELRLQHGDKEARADSLSALMSLGLVLGSEVRLRARGDDAEAALAEAIELLSTPEGIELEVAAEPLASVGEGELAGLVASPGLAIGPLVALSLPLPLVPYDGADVAGERTALGDALERVSRDLEASREAAERRGQRAEADIFDAHLAWLEDPSLREAAEQRIDAGRSAGQAWREALDIEAEQLSASGNAVLVGRVADLRDLQRHVMAEFADPADTPALEVPEGGILAAEDLSPSQFVDLAACGPAGLCLAGGGTTSHVAILARARGIPCLVAMGEALSGVAGERVVLDADQGRLELEPGEARLGEVRERLRLEAQRRETERAAAFEPAVTLDGRVIEVAANIGNRDEARLAAESGADGVGLMRSEFLFLGRESAPGEAEQRGEYQASLAALGGKPVIIRTLDIGADKQLPYLRLPEVPNPALGGRGVRLWHDQPELLDTQLRALLRVEGRESLRIMVPMVSEAGELAWVRQRLEALAAELGIADLPRLGAMVEVPSAALCAASLAEQVDFLSIGTNDLTQYGLAMDREDPRLAARADVLHPGVLRLIQATVEGAAGRCPVGVCGAAAGDPLAALVLVALGVDELSVEPARVAAVKAMVRRLDAGALAGQLPALLSLADAESVRRQVDEWQRLATETTTTLERTTS